MSDQPIEVCTLEGQSLTDHINSMNGRVLRGEQVTDEEIRAAIIAMRTRRKFASAASPTTKKAATKPIADLDLMALFTPKK